MIIEPMSKGFICLTAHPEGCAANVAEQIAVTQAAGRKSGGPKTALIIGSSTGYGLASRIVAAFGYGAKTLGVFFERPAEGKRTASPGWYNTAAFERAAAKEGLWARSLNGDAFSKEMKARAIKILKEEAGPVDLLVYSLASPRRTHPVDGVTYTSVLKPIGKTYTSKTANFQNGQVSEVSLEPANEADIANTVAVMGGEDWRMWVDALQEADMLAPKALTVAYSYAGPSTTADIYREGTIGKAKEHLEKTANELDRRLAPKGGRAVVSVNKAVVTQASAAIPAMPLYISLLHKIMKAKGLHEGCIEQMVRLFNAHLYAANPPAPDALDRIRIDDWEMREDVQKEVTRMWEEATTENVEKLADLAAYRHEFFKLFGFGAPGVDYAADTEPNVAIPSLANGEPVAH